MARLFRSSARLAWGGCIRPGDAELGRSVALIRPPSLLQTGVLFFVDLNRHSRRSQSFNTAPVAAFNHFAVDLALLWEDNPRHLKSLPLDASGYPSDCLPFFLSTVFPQKSALLQSYLYRPHVMDRDCRFILRAERYTKRREGRGRPSRCGF